MTWTYDSDVTTDRDKVRFLIGDTVSEDPQLDDGEVAFLLTQYGSVQAAALAACRALIAKYSRLCDKWVGDLKILASQKQLHYTRLLESLVTTSGNLAAIPSAGGISVGQKESYESDTDRVAPAFRRGQDDNV